MYIDDRDYRTDLASVNNIRYLFFVYLYNDPAYIESLKDIITRHIDCLSIDYEPTEYAYVLKIKKTAMRKIHGFNNDPTFYYPIIDEIFREFMNTHRDKIVSILSIRYDDPNEAFNSVLDKDYTMANMCFISCISDNMVYIKL
jgi:hypothetical protein